MEEVGRVDERRGLCTRRAIVIRPGLISPPTVTREREKEEEEEEEETERI